MHVYNSNSTIGDFLKNNSNFWFDPHMHMKGLKHAELLANDLQSFKDSKPSFYSHSHAEQDILQFIKTSPTIPNRDCRKTLNAKHLSDIPSISRLDLQNSMENYINPSYKGCRWYKSTSGSTGQPLLFQYCDRYYFSQLHLPIYKALFMAGIDTSVKGNALCMHITDTQSSASCIIVDAITNKYWLLQSVIDPTDPNSIKNLFIIINDVRPHVITARPEILESVLLQGYNDGLHLVDAPACIVSSGSMMKQTLRQDLENTLGANVTTAYALSEFGIVAYECKSQAGLHVDTSLLYHEVTNHIRSDSVGELVLSTKYNAAMPLIRYRTSDLARVIESQCMCGSSLPRIDLVRGRSVSCLVSMDGRKFAPTYFNNLTSLFGIANFQINQRDLGSIDILVEPVTSEFINKNITGQIVDYIQRSIPFTLHVNARLDKIDTSNDFQRYTSEVY